jgi:hypothetical protein
MKVLATSTKTGKTQPETITAVLVHHDTDLYDLKIRDHGKTSVIDTTSNHLFWVPGAGRSGAGGSKPGHSSTAPTSAPLAAAMRLQWSRAGSRGSGTAGCGT